MMDMMMADTNSTLVMDMMVLYTNSTSMMDMIVMDTIVKVIILMKIMVIDMNLMTNTNTTSMIDMKLMDMMMIDTRTIMDIQPH